MGQPAIKLEHEPSFFHLFQTTARVRVLDYLLANGEDSISRIAGAIRNNHANVRMELEFFIAHDLVREKRFGRIRVFCLNAGHPTVRALLAFYHQVEG